MEEVEFTSKEVQELAPASQVAQGMACSQNWEITEWFKWQNLDLSLSIFTPYHNLLILAEGRSVEVLNISNSTYDPFVIVIWSILMLACCNNNS